MMKTIDINPGHHHEPVKLNYFDTNQSRSLLLIVGGSGDTRGSLAPLATRLMESNSSYAVATFSFRGTETKNSYTLGQRVSDLQEVLDYFIANAQDNISILCTSMGAYPTCFVLSQSKYRAYVPRAIFLDPADYEMDAEREAASAKTLSGGEPYVFASETASTLLGHVRGKTIIDTIRLTIRNYGLDAYARPEVRNQSDLALYPRLNAGMVASFYERTPVGNRGQYLELPNVPHAFMRDGDTKKNIETLTAVITDLL